MLTVSLRSITILLQIEINGNEIKERRRNKTIQVFAKIVKPEVKIKRRFFDHFENQILLL